MSVVDLKSNIKDHTNLVEYVREYLYERRDGIHFTEIGREIFMLPDMDQSVLKLAVEQLMTDEKGFTCDADGRWHTVPSPQLDFPFSDLDFVVVDLETTGGGNRKHRIIEIGAVKIRGKEIIDSISGMINPLREIPKYVAQITGISQEMTADAPTAPESIPELIEFIGKSVIVGHNLPYDLGFINATLSRMASRRLSNHTLCTLELSRLLLTRLKNHKLEDVCAYFHIHNQARHRALGDAEATAKLLLNFISMLEDAGVVTLRELYKLLPKRKRVDASELMINKRDIQSLPTGKGVFIFFDVHDEIIYVKCASFIRRAVRHFIYGRDTKSLLMKQLIRHVVRVGSIGAGSMIQAKFDEIDLIDRHHPRFNMLHKQKIALLKSEKVNGDQLQAIPEQGMMQNDSSYYGPVFDPNLIDFINNTILSHRFTTKRVALPGGNMDILTPDSDKVEMKMLQRVTQVKEIVIYVSVRQNYPVLEMFFIQNRFLIGTESVHFIDDALDLLRGVLLQKVSPYLRPFIQGFPPVLSHADLLRALAIYRWESKMLFLENRIRVVLPHSHHLQVVNNILRIGYQSIVMNKSRLW
ncbi:MAG: hypothetical protein B6244_07275 [Candidatus Cloacimonetes bacterium 4572_55]|nr:MAG: hypothetical protein B6244_07275 [Candidatus Cloacimonetes bacterium 4572_55]